MRSTRFASVISLVLLSGCSSGSNAGTPSNDAAAPSSSPSGDSPGSACDLYLQCVAAATPSDLPIALQAYGPSGTCWGGSATLDADCESACKESMATIGGHFAVCGPQNGTGAVGDGATGTPSDGPDAGGPVGSGSGSGGGTGSGAGSATGESCSECANKLCSPSLENCADSKACTNVYACIGACSAGDTTCQTNCASGTMTSDDYDAYRDLDVCLAGKCGAPCDPF